MPSHIFIHVGAWAEAAATNARAVVAAKHANEPNDQLHTMDYLVYAYLQLARDGDARRVVEDAATSRALIPIQPSAPGRLHELQELVAAWRGPGTLVLVTHGFTVQALLGFLPDQGATVVLKPGSGYAAPAELVGLIARPQ
jgi:hypothetical protein